MAHKFRTKIAHKKGSEIHVFGHTIALTPDEGQGDPGICSFEVPEARDDVFARLLEIPEGFELLGEVWPDDSEQPQLPADKLEPAPAPMLVIEGDNGAKIDLYQADKATLVAIGKDLGLTFANKLGVDKVREQVIEAFKATVKA